MIIGRDLHPSKKNQFNLNNKDNAKFDYDTYKEFNF